MDDVCDSLNTVKQVQKQTGDIDKILETGGFHRRNIYITRIKETVKKKWQ